MLRRNVLLLLFILFTFKLSGQNTLIKTSDDEIFRTGMELLAHAKYSAAREFFQRYVDLNKDDLKSVEAEYYVAYSAMNVFHADAEQLFENFIARHPYHSKAAFAYFELANFNFTNKKYDKAIEYYEKVDPTRLSQEQSLERSYRLGYSYFSKKDFEKAGILFNDVKRTENKHTYAASYYAGFIELKNGQYQEALTDLRKAEQNETYKPLVPVMIATIYYQQGAYDELIAYAEKALSGSGGKSLHGKEDIFLLMADAYFYKKDYPKSVEYFRKYRAEYKTKGTPQVLYRLGFSEYKIKDYDAAITSLKTVGGTKDSTTQAAAYYLGLSYLKKGNKEFALSAFDLAAGASFSPEIREEALFNQGKVLFDLRRYNEAIKALKNFTKEYPSSKHNEEAQELLSEAFLRTSNYTEALTYIESLKSRSNRINTAYQRVTFYSGVQLFNNGKYAEAIKMFEKSAEHPIDKEIYLAALFWKGEAYSVSRDYDNAIRNYSSVFQKTDDRNEYHLKSRYGIGYAYFNTKQYDKAFPHFKTYVERLKNASNKQFYNDALLRLADLHYESKQYDGAIKYYNEAIAGKINDMDYAYYQRGVVYGIENKPSEAKSSLDIVINNYPRSVYHDDAIFEKAQINSQLGNFAETVSGYSKLIREKEGSPYIPYALLKRASAYTNMEKYEDAIRDYESILTHHLAHPVAEDAFLGLQDLYGRTGKTEEFKKWITVMENVDPKNTLLVTARFNDAKNLYFAEKYKQSIDAFTNYINAYPDNSNVVEAKFYLADAFSRTDEHDHAIKTYKSVIETKDPLYYTRSINRIADIQFRRREYGEAKVYYNLLLANARTKKEKQTALTGLMDSHFITDSYDSTIAYAEEIRKLGNLTVDAESRALLYAGKSYYAKEDFEKATDYFVNTINLAKDRNGAEAQYLMAEIQYKQKKHRQSLETLYQLNNTFSEYDDWLGKTFLLVADNFIALNETLQAKATLKSIVENSTHQESVEKAKEKLADLEAKEKEGKEEPTNE